VTVPAPPTRTFRLTLESLESGGEEQELPIKPSLDRHQSDVEAMCQESVNTFFFLA